MRSLLFGSFLSLLAVTASVADPQAQVAAAIDGFHDAAAAADADGYLGLLTDDTVFLGTDASERWPGPDFRIFVTEHFSKGRGWTYKATERHVSISEDGRTAWFDELLKNENLGQCRGSGVLVRTSQGWKIAQYNLSIPIPNELATEFTARIKGLVE